MAAITYLHRHHVEIIKCRIPDPQEASKATKGFVEMSIKKLLLDISFLKDTDVVNRASVSCTLSELRRTSW